MPVGGVVSGLRGLFLDLGPLREYRDYRIVYFGQLVSNVGASSDSKNGRRRFRLAIR